MIDLRLARAGAALGLVVVAASCTAPPAPRNPVSVVLVTIDTLRADHLGAYGGAVRTPNLDGLARNGGLFLNAFAQSPLTLPSHSTILTGTLPTYHGVRDNGRYRLPEDLDTLAEILKGRGYSTAAFVGAFPVDSRFGLGQGFDRYDDAFDRTRSRLAFPERRAEAVVSAALDWLGSDRAGPYFLWVHLFDPHAPYDPPAPFAGVYDNPYDGEVAYVDDALGRLLGAVGDDAVVVVTGDHGEGLGQHGEATHSLFVYDSTLRVPLILRAPGVPAGTVVEDPVRSVDILPTVLELAGNPVGCEQCQGRSLVPLLRGSSLPPLPVYAETYFPRFNLGWSELETLRSDGFKYIAAPEPELYDLRADPGETHNLAASDRDRVSRLASELQRFKASTRGPHGGIEPPALDPETASLLRSLGYLASANPRTGSPDAPRPDPKHELPTWEKVRSGMDSFARGRTRAAIDDFEGALREQPELVLARSYLAQAYFDVGRYQDAVRESTRVVSEEPSDFDGTLLLGRSLFRLGRVEEARNVLTVAASLDPQSSEPWVELAQTYLRRESTAEAKAYLDKAASLEPDSYGVLLLSGKLAVVQGNPGDAEGLFRRALESKPYEEEPRVQLGNLLLTQRRLEEAKEVFLAGIEGGREAPGLLVGLGNVHALSGRMNEAIPLLEKAQRLAPDSPSVLNSLGFAYLQTGRRAQGLALLKRSLDAQPDQPELVAFLKQAAGR